MRWCDGVGIGDCYSLIYEDPQVIAMDDDVEEDDDDDDDDGYWHDNDSDDE